MSIDYSQLSTQSRPVFREDNFFESQKKKQKEDLEYLISIKNQRKQMENFVKEQEQREFNRRAEMMKEEDEIRKMKLDHIHKSVMIKNYELTHQKRDVNNSERVVNSKEQSNYLSYLDRLKQIDDQKKLEENNLIKNFKTMEYQNHLLKKQMEREKKLETYKENNMLLNQQIKMSIDRENEYKNKIQKMNNRIFDNVNSYNLYFNKKPITDSQELSSEKDYILNMKLRAINKEKPLIERQGRVKDRIQQEEEYNKILERAKSEKNHSQQLLKGFLEYQMSNKSQNEYNTVNKQANDLILPSYFQENRPVPTFRKAADPITLMKLSNNYSKSIEYLKNNNNNTKENRWESSLPHNPISNPMDDVNYNKYLSKSLSQGRELSNTSK